MFFGPDLYSYPFDSWNKNIFNITCWSVTRKPDPPFLVPPGPNISRYLDPSEQKFLKYLDLLEIFYPPIILSAHCLTARGINKSHLKYLIPQLVIIILCFRARQHLIFSMHALSAPVPSHIDYMQYLAC